jgi:2-polyprenyl-3-methyl-5-hydroxy-6-metoxy-1,4-benzoquinol methylase
MSNPERYDPHADGFKEQTGRHHRKRYEFASSFTGRDYLDMCSGQGYGANMLKLAHPTARVDGVEIDQECVDNANKEYPDCFYYVGDITEPFARDQYDVVTFFEALEHITYRDGLHTLQYIYNKVLKPGGKLIVSTPRDIQDKHNHYHLSAWPFHELKNHLGSIFGKITILGQSWETGEIDDEDVIDNDFYVCVCTK